MKDAPSMTRVATELRWFLEYHNINESDVRVEIHCKDRNTQARLQVAHLSSQHPIELIQHQHTAIVKPFEAQIVGMRFTWTCPDKWDVRR